MVNQNNEIIKLLIVKLVTSYNNAWVRQADAHHEDKKARKYREENLGQRPSRFSGFLKKKIDTAHSVIL